MTFSSRTVGVRCKTCNHGIMEIYYGDKIYGPYQKISHTSRSDHTERNWLDRETIFYHHIVDKEKCCHCFLKLICVIHLLIIMFFAKTNLMILVKKKKKLIAVLFDIKCMVFQIMKWKMILNLFAVIAKGKDLWRHLRVISRSIKLANLKEISFIKEIS